MCGNAVWVARRPDNGVTLWARDVGVRERHLNVVQTDAAQRLEVQVIDVGPDEHSATAECRGTLAEHGAGGARRRHRNPSLEAKSGPAARRTHGKITDVLADRRTDERNQRAVVDRKSTRLNSSHEWISYAVF